MSPEGQSLNRRIIAVLLSASLVPLAALGIGSWIVFGRLLDREAVQLMKSVVQGHTQCIEDYLAERISLMRILAETQTLEQLTESYRLGQLLDALNKASGNSFIDLGVIDANGRHLAYAGPYNLLARNYHDAVWFGEVLAKDTYISDVFLGFRGVPHCIIAAKVMRKDAYWILRATINSEQFARMVQPGLLGPTGDVYIINRDGYYQTISKSGGLLEKANVEIIDHLGVRESRVVTPTRNVIRATTWVNNNRWLLVVEQDESAVQWPLQRAVFTGMIVILVAVFILVATTIAATGRLTRIIDQANAQREEIRRAFTRSAKLASIGEMATGIAHEINNPLAIISSEQTNISDLASTLTESMQNRREILDSVQRSQRQVQRCAGITRKMLQFGRKTETKIEPTDLSPRLNEIISLMSKQAQIKNVELIHDFEQNLPQVVVDSLELEQVVVNLINNGIDAMKNGGRIVIRAQRQERFVHLTVSDTGPGMSPEVQEKIFEPFFTTKPVGKGTGLGLSVCFGMVTGWGGRIECESSEGRGTTMHIYLPAQVG